jgi:HSP20 family molecular chaperone IbpA
MSQNRIKLAPDTVAYADGDSHKLIVEFAIPGAPTETIDVQILADSIHLTAPARDTEYVAALALSWPVKPEKAEATYNHGLLRIEVPFKDPMEDAVKVAIKTVGADAKSKKVTTGAATPATPARGSDKPLAAQPVQAS